MDEVPRYKTLQGTFIEPEYVKEGTLIEFDGEPGPHLEPLNEAAREMMNAYFKAHPEATLTPLEQLPATVGANPAPVMRVLGEAPMDEVRSFVDMSDKTGKGGKAKVTTLAEAKAGGAA